MTHDALTQPEPIVRQPSRLRAIRSGCCHSCLAPALVAVGLHATFMILFLFAHGGDPSAFVCVGKTQVGHYPYEAITVAIGDKGFDGAYYYAIARHPWQRHEIGIDLPAVRHARILYPALAWFLTAGDPYMLPWALPAINLIAIGVLAWLGAWVARASGLSIWWGVLLPLALNAGSSAQRDLTDVVSCAALAVLLTAVLFRWPWAILLSSAAAALFARESNVVILVAILAATAWRGQWRCVGGLVGAMLLWGCWIVTLRIVYGQWPMLPAKENTAPPFLGLAYGWSYLGGTSSKFGSAFNACCLLILMTQLVLVAVLIYDRADASLICTALAVTALALTGGEAIYCDRWSYLRVYSPLPLALWLGFARAGRWRLLLVLSVPVVLPLQAALSPWFLGN